MNRLILRWFHSFYEVVRGEVESMLIKNKRSSQNGLNEADGFLLDKERADDIKKPMVYGLQLITIFCVLFSFASIVEAKAQELRPGGATGFDVVSDTMVKGHKIILYNDQSFKNNPRFDLDRYPFMDYEVDTTMITKVQLGDMVPDEVMDMPLWVVGKSTVSDTVTLRELGKDKLLVLDFWASWCRPCVVSMNDWEAIQEQFPEEVVLLGVHMDYDFRAYPFVKAKDWSSYSVIGLNANLLNWHFFNRRVLSTMAWIRDGRFVAATGTKGYDVDLIGRYLQDSSVEIPMKLEVLHSLKVN